MPDIFHNYVYCSKCPLPSFGIYKTTGAEREIFRCSEVLRSEAITGSEKGSS